jgi:hypothetical protein
MEISDVKLTRASLAIVPLIFAAVPFAHAQTSFDLNIGFGTARAGSNGAGIDNLNSANALGPCIPGSFDPFCQRTPALNGFFLGLGGDIMLHKHYGVGAEINFQPAKQSYGPLDYRETFYDFNGIFAPVNRSRVQVQVQGGIGGARTGFSLTQNQCVGIAVCSLLTQPVGNASHFQLHTGVGVQVYVTQHLFIRPQIDLHYIPNFTDQFGRNSVPEGTVWVGYSFGDRS